MLTACMLAGVLWFAAEPAAPRGPQFSDAQAQAHFDAAVERFAADDFEGASAALHRAYEVEPIAELLYARAQAERRLEHWGLAADLYAQYLATDPPTAQADNARRPLLFCRAMAARGEGDCGSAGAAFETYVELYPDGPDAAQARNEAKACRDADAPVSSPAPSPRETPPPAVLPESAVVDPHPAPAGRPWHRDPAGGALVGVGLALAAAGTTVALVGRARFVQGQGADGHDAADTAMGRGIRLERAGVVVAAGGGVVALAGVARWIVVGTRPRRSARRARVTAMGLSLRW